MISQTMIFQGRPQGPLMQNIQYDGGDVAKTMISEEGCYMGDAAMQIWPPLVFSKEALA